jgi:ribonuclease HI
MSRVRETPASKGDHANTSTGWLPRVVIYTDGACSGNPGPGGWGAIILRGEKVRQLKGGASETTNNRMELTAIIEALNALRHPANVTIYTDSEYVQRGAEIWLPKWKKNGWCAATGRPVKNFDLWRQFDEAQFRHTVRFKWVKGHNGDHYNEQVDSLAHAGSRAYPETGQ